MFSGIDMSRESYEDDVVRLQTEGKPIPVRFLAREIDRLRAELAKANEAISLSVQEIGVWSRKCGELESRCKELELILQGKTFCYDPDSYEKGRAVGRIEGMEEAKKVFSDTWEDAKRGGLFLFKFMDAIRSRIEEVKNANR